MSFCYQINFLCLLLLHSLVLPVLSIKYWNVESKLEIGLYRLKKIHRTEREKIIMYNVKFVSNVNKQLLPVLMNVFKDKQDLYFFFKPVYFTAGWEKIKICYAVVNINIMGLYFIDGNKWLTLRWWGFFCCFGFFSIYLDFNPVLLSLRVTIFFLAGLSHSNIFGYVMEIVLNPGFSMLSAATAKHYCLLFFWFYTENYNLHL